MESSSCVGGEDLMHEQLGGEEFEVHAVRALKRFRITEDSSPMLRTYRVVQDPIQVSAPWKG